MQKKHGFKPLGPADGPIKTAVFGGTNAKLYNYDISKRTDIGPNRDRFARMKEEYEKNGPARSNLRYAYVPARSTGRHSAKYRLDADQPQARHFGCPSWDGKRRVETKA